MNKTSLFPTQTLIRSVLILTLCALLSTMPIQMAKADAAPPPDPTVGGVEPYQPQNTNVQMMSETVFIEVPPSPTNVEEPKRIRVNASFTMQNQSQTEEQMQVIFPLTRLGYEGSSEQALYAVDPSSFRVTVNGRTVPITEVTTPLEILGEKVSEVLWAAFEVAFPVNQDILLQVEYDMRNEYGVYGEGFTGIAYILETGAGWYGNILSADITLRLPYPVTEEAIRYANPGYVISGNEMHWQFKNLEPTREDNLEMRVIHADIWQAILDQRARVEQFPDDADAWAELGDRYQEQGISTMEWAIIRSDPHFMQLALEARQKAVALRPEWGDAHCKLAEVFWLGNPAVQQMFRQGGNSTAPDLHQDDPAVQQVIYELQEAWTYGTTECFDGDLYQYLKQAFPELELTPPEKGTSTVAPPTETLAPVITDTALPTDSPTLIPSPPPTPVPIEEPVSIPYGVLITTALGLAIIIGVFAFGLKSKSG